MRLVARFGGVDDDHALVHVDLRRGEADAFGGVHRLEHVVDELADALVDCRHRPGHCVQARIGVAKDVELGHLYRIDSAAGRLWMHAQRKEVRKVSRTEAAQRLTFVAISML